MKTKIGIKQRVPKDDWYCGDDFFYFKCPNCEEEHAIRFEDNYCSNCGSELEWDRDDKANEL
jgi:predicted RNA-binding Zn-ribbon protein involved in translation (DUF1610 family)